MPARPNCRAPDGRLIMPAPTLIPSLSEAPTLPLPPQSAHRHKRWCASRRRCYLPPNVMPPNAVPTPTQPIARALPPMGPMPLPGAVPVPGGAACCERCRSKAECAFTACCGRTAMGCRRVRAAGERAEPTRSEAGGTTPGTFDRDQRPLPVRSIASKRSIIG